MTRISKKKRIQALIAVYSIAAIDNFGYAVVFVLLPILLLNPKFGFVSVDMTMFERYIALGALFAAFPIAQFFGAPVFGDLADSYGRKRVFYYTILGTILGYFFTGIAMHAKSISLIFFSRLFTGFFSANKGLCNASIADLSPDEKQRAKNYGTFTVILGVSMPLAIIFGGYLSDPEISSYFSPPLPFYLTGCITILAYFVVYYFYTETFKVSRKPFKIALAKGIRHIIEAFSTGNVRRFILLIFLWTVGWGISGIWFGAYAIDRFQATEIDITWGFVIEGFFWAFGGAVVNPLLLKFLNIKSVALLSFILTSFFLLIAGLMPSFLSLTLAFSVSAIFSAISLSSSYSLISLNSPIDMQGKAMGITQAVLSVGFLIAPLIGSLIGIITIFLFFPISALIVFFGAIVLFCKPSRKGKI